MLIEVSQKEKVKNHMISLMWDMKQKAINQQTRQTNQNS